MEYADLNLREYVNLNIKALHFFGYFRPDTDLKCHRLMYNIYSLIALNMWLIPLTLSECMNMYQVYGDIEQMAAGSFLFFSHLIHFVKLYYIRSRSVIIWNLVHDINRKEFLPKNVEQYEFIKNEIQRSKIIFKVFLWLCIICASFFSITPWIGEEQQKRILPYGGWYPKEKYVLAYSYQIIAAPMNGLGNISIDTFMSGLIMVVAGQLKILNNSIRNIKKLAEIRIISKSNPEVLNEEMNNVLIECIMHHKYILEFSKTLNYIFSECLMGQFVFSATIICFTLFKMTLVPVSDIQFLTLIFYLICMLMEIFLWCYYGNEVIINSTELTQSAYISDWTDCTRKYKINLLFFMIRSQRCLSMYAGGFFKLSLETFVAILKSSWSYFAVLNHIHSQ